MSEDWEIKQLKKRIQELESEIRDFKRGENVQRTGGQTLAALIEILPHGVQECTLDGLITFSNSAHHRMLGFANGELIGKYVWELLADESEKDNFPQLLKHLAENHPPPQPYVNQNVTKDGRCIDVQVDWNYKYDAQGHLTGFISVITDVSDRQAATRALKESEQRYRALFEKAGDAIFLLEAEGPDRGRIIDTNQAAADIHGYTMDEIKGLSIQDLDTVEEAEKVQERTQKMLAGEWFQAEISHRRKDGSVFPVEVSAGLIRIGDKKMILAFDRDVSIRKMAEERLKESESRYRALFEGIGEGILLVEIETKKIKYVNPAVCSFLGYSPQELTGLLVADIQPQEEMERSIEVFNALASGELSLAKQIPFSHKEGRLVYADVRTSRIELNGRPYLAGFFSDVTAQKGIEDKLNDQVHFLQTLIDTLPHPIFYKDFEGRYMGCNQAFEVFSGLRKAELIGKTVYDIAPKDLADIYYAADNDLFEKTIPQIYETSVQYPDGTRREVIFNKAVFYKQDGSPAGLVGAMIDITERKLAEEEKVLREKQLRQSQKMEAMGTLAGGIAHDFNNILSAIVGYSDIALHETAPDSPITGYLKKVLGAGERARALVKQILAFSRITEQETRPVVVKTIVKEVLKLMQATLPSTISIQSDLASGAAIMADPTQIHQVVMNLCTNASHAMQVTGGHLTVTLSEEDAAVTHKDSIEDMMPGPYLQLSVSDTGTGIDSVIIERIFDPFFTTKVKGEGTGMGLAVVHGIVKECGGSIHVQSIKGKGTTFQVLLPIIDTEEDSTSEIITPLPTGHERILFIDDEPDIVEVGLQMLTILGYKVTAFNDSHEALELFSRTPHDFDMVITDMTMPKMTGDVLSRSILDVRPDIPVVICTGYSDKVNADSITSMGLSGIAYKPLVMKDLAYLIRSVLDKNDLKSLDTH